MSIIPWRYAQSKNKRKTYSTTYIQQSAVVERFSAAAVGSGTRRLRVSSLLKRDLAAVYLLPQPSFVRSAASDNLITSP